MCSGWLTFLYIIRRKKNWIRFPLAEAVLACDTFHGHLCLSPKPWPKATRQGVGLSHITAYSSSWSLGAGSNKNLEAGTEAEAMEVGSGVHSLVLLASSAYFYNLGPLAERKVAPPTLGWARPHQSLMLHRPSRRKQFLSGDPLFQEASRFFCKSAFPVLFLCPCSAFFPLPDATVQATLNHSCKLFPREKSDSPFIVTSSLTHWSPSLGKQSGD